MLFKHITDDGKGYMDLAKRINTALTTTAWKQSVQNILCIKSLNIRASPQIDTLV
jgi:hypothetical protein